MPLHLLLAPCFAFITFCFVNIMVIKIRYPTVQNSAKLVHGLPLKMSLNFAQFSFSEIGENIFFLQRLTRDKKYFSFH